MQLHPDVQSVEARRVVAHFFRVLRRMQVQEPSSSVTGIVPLADPLEVQHHPDAVPCRFGQEGIRVVRAADAARKARGPACRREPLNHGHTGTRLGQVVGAARTVDARADDHDIGPGLIHEGKPPSDWG